jgi:hypothetical protein
MVAICFLWLVAGTAVVHGADAASAENGTSVLAEGWSGRTEWRAVTSESGEPPSRCFTMEQRVHGGAGPWHFAESQCSLPWLRLETIGPEQTASSLVFVAAATPGYAKVRIERHGGASGLRRTTLSQVSVEGTATDTIYFAEMTLASRICVKSITLFGGPQPTIVKNPADGDPQHCSESAIGSR